MQKETKEIIKLSIIEILKYMEAKAELILDPIMFDMHPMARLFHDGPFVKQVDLRDLKRKIQYLKQRGLIRKSYENKKYYLEITASGMEHSKKMQFRHLSTTNNKKWDKKWRVVIYDIPEDDKDTRDAIRRKLYQIGFKQIQKSVFVYPFECSYEINLICNYYGERNCLKYMIAEIIEGEESIIETFMDKKVLTAEDLS